MNPHFSDIRSRSELTAEQTATASRYLAATRDALLQSTAGLSSSQWAFKPAPDRWPIAEIVEHVVLIENGVHGIIGTLSAAPEAAPGHVQTEMDHFILTEVPQRSTKLTAPAAVGPTRHWSGAEAVAHFLKSRERTVQLLAAPSLRGHVVPHPVYGLWDGYQWLLAAAAHSARHTEQIREVQAAPDFPAPL